MIAKSPIANHALDIEAIMRAGYRVATQRMRTRMMALISINEINGTGSPTEGMAGGCVRKGEGTSDPLQKGSTSQEIAFYLSVTD